MTDARETTFGQTLRHLRLASGLTQEELAERAGLSVRGISDLERGLSHRARRETIGLLAEALALTPEGRSQLEQAGRSKPDPSSRQNPQTRADTSVDRRFAANNLPSHLTSFVGREREVAAVSDQLSKARLVTLTGAGGSGKTRLALRVASSVADSFPDGVWLVELGALADSALIPQLIASAVNTPEVPGRSISSSLIEHIRSRHLLLVLDNCEHLVEACASIVESLLLAGPHLRILATSRELLSVPGEVIWSVPTLTSPDLSQWAGDDGEIPIPVVMEYEAVRLFVDRARMVAPEFGITADNAPILARICHRLDGMPLAIELAAAQVKLISLDQIASRLDDCFEVLGAGPRTVSARQRTLRAAIQWSYDLLTEKERTLFCRLSVFAGGFSIEAAESIMDATASPILELLGHLVDKSLVLVVQSNRGPTRYRLLETIRQFAAEKLRAAGESSAIGSQHARFFLDLAESAESWLWGVIGRGPWLQRLEGDLDNLRAAISWSQQDHGDIEVGLRIVGALWWFWILRDHPSEGRGYSNAMLERVDSTAITRLHARALTSAGALAWFQNDYSVAKTTLQEASNRWRALGDNHSLAIVLTLLSRTLRDLGESTSASILAAESVRYFREASEPWGLAWSLNNLGYVTIEDSGADPKAHLLESLERFRQLGDGWGGALALSNLGYLAYRAGDYEQARRDLEAALDVFRGNDRWSAPRVLTILGNLARWNNDSARAAELYGESLRLSRLRVDQAGVAIARFNLAWLALDGDDPPHAGALFVQSLAYFHDQQDRQGIVECLFGLARVAASRGQDASAHRLLAAIESFREVGGLHWWSAIRPEIEREVTCANRELDQSNYFAARSHGPSLTIEEAIEAGYAVGRSTLLSYDLPGDSVAPDRRQTTSS